MVKIEIVKKNSHSKETKENGFWPLILNGHTHRMTNFITVDLKIFLCKNCDRVTGTLAGPKTITILGHQEIITAT